jgi:hypothetical protein
MFRSPSLRFSAFSCVDVNSKALHSAGLANPGIGGVEKKTAACFSVLGMLST